MHKVAIFFAGTAWFEDIWALLLGILTLAVLAYGAILVPNFGSAFNLSQLAAGMVEKALLILPMVLLIIAREIDLSVASILALSSVIFGLLLKLGVPLLATLPLVVIFGAALGAINGALIVNLGLRTLVVTLGTMALYRGIGFIIVGTGSINVFPAADTDFGIGSAPGTRIPYIIPPFLILARGISVWGGKGRLTGVLLALVLVAAIRNILGISQIGGDTQGMVIGLLLIGSLLISNSTGFLVAWLRNIGALPKTNG